ncbi:MAG: hypothetical protein RSA29_02765 [Clostridium sp.]
MKSGPIVTNDEEKKEVLWIKQCTKCGYSVWSLKHNTICSRCGNISTCNK